MKMFPFSFKNRIAFNYLISTALMVLFVFVIIYNIVSYSVYSHVDNDIKIEVNGHLSEIKIENDNVTLIDPEEWREEEHRSLDVNPVFVQILDGNKELVNKSPNLKNRNLIFDANQEDFKNFDTKLNGRSIRQIQFPVLHKKKIAGYIIIAMSLEDANLVLQNLRDVLLVSYPIILLLLFFTARFIAGRNIRPITNITETASAITKDNLKSRIDLPSNKDELYVLSHTINSLLDRIENAIDREKQFTSDASHELRTPLAVVKGTLEVLIRKPREKEQYEEKIKYCISEIDRLNNMVDQLLLLARFENQKIGLNNQPVELDAIILQSLERFSSGIESANISIDFKFDNHFSIYSDAYLIATIIENLISNAIKYSKSNGLIRIHLSEASNFINCKISDNGIGIQKADLANIYGQFFRSQATAHPAIKGTGLGLSIVKRLCDLLQCDIQIESEIGKGTTVSIQFPK
ncbi:two-component sensor histidine kinase [Flavobacterium noncentrifugens]|uniref:histidine kinase n=1 Tax=Flavobacterium noncentrifugens TaxID=1128970 RepID=A0A1G9A472_9FLAO|nr:ATP-binding protein [Flavobacterium noncentrifugens]GEP51731.1 two-component sensor histidine kinase [Flavobacterium noncentrifugens]SDK21654.1 Signal transduction histidine kinase [Flavobacterium noncentrifugens]